MSTNFKCLIFDPFFSQKYWFLIHFQKFLMDVFNDFVFVFRKSMFQIDLDTLKKNFIMRKTFCQNALKNTLGQGKRKRLGRFFGYFYTYRNPSGFMSRLCTSRLQIDFKSSFLTFSDNYLSMSSHRNLNFESFFFSKNFKNFTFSKIPDGCVR